MYTSIYPILISESIWVPLSISHPFEKNKNIIEQINPDIFLYDENLDKKLISLLKKKLS
jgi:hypothetical protein